MGSLMADLTDAQDAIADAVTAYVDTRPGKDFTASQLARVAKLGHVTQDVYTVLDWLIAHDMLAPCGRGGAWRRYRAREFGEMPSTWETR